MLKNLGFYLYKHKTFGIFIDIFYRRFSPFTGNSERISFLHYSNLPVIPAIYRP